MSPRVAFLVGLAFVGLLVCVWPRDAVPSIRPRCEVEECRVDGSPPYPVFADSGTAKFFRLVMPAYYALFLALSPLGYVLWHIREVAEALYRWRVALMRWARIRLGAPVR